jgi:thiamine pyrophosphokinase
MAVTKTVILGGANISDYKWLQSEINDGDKVICADSGLHHAHTIGINPDIIIGDFDSVDKNLLAQYREKSEIIEDNDQNTTDLMKALRHIDTNVPTHIYGAIGQRADHDFSNYLILMGMDYPDRIALCSPNEKRHIVKHPFTLNGARGDIVGIFPLSKITNFKVEGLKYSPDILGGPYVFGWNGACNEMTDEMALISFHEGMILITHTRKN